MLGEQVRRVVGEGHQDEPAKVEKTRRLATQRAAHGDQGRANLPGVESQPCRQEHPQILRAVLDSRPPANVDDIREVFHQLGSS